eukprot:TRINITY_DN24138_c1_g1_i2.p2 TRINITY_DN24138_c1_g1~~TRINITY_DN24138_c1_g1_i2.p2  ORF type:complete len:187 (-),score=63.20 TRINITY_DN24138_c1_g1_i2:123-656(-)
MTPPPPPAGQAHEDLVARGRALLESLAEAVEGDLLGREGQDEETHDEDVAATFQAYGYQPLDVVDEDAEGGLEQWPDGSQWPPDTALPPEEIAPQEEEEQQQQQQQQKEEETTIDRFLHYHHEPMAQEQVDAVRAAMQSVTLPPEAFPEWAGRVPEAEWLDPLIQRVKQHVEEPSGR